MTMLDPCRSWFAPRAIAVAVFLALVQFGFAGTAVAACGVDAGAVIANLPDELADALKKLPKSDAGERCEPVAQKAPKKKPVVKSTGRMAGFRAIEGEFVKDEVVALITGGEELANEIASVLNLTVRASTDLPMFGAFLVRFGIPDKRPVSVVRALVADIDGVEASVANHIYRLNGESRQKKKLPRYALKAAQIEGVEERGRGVKIGIIDTDIDDKHPSLVNAVQARFDALDGAERRSLTHGTGIALLIAGGDPFVGAAPEAALYAARAFDVDAKGAPLNSVYAILRSLDWMLSQRVDIVNMSFAGPENKLVTRAIKTLGDQGVLLVAAAGNHGPRAPFAFPAANDEVIAVTAIDARNRVYGKANQGRYVFVSAPGVDVLVLEANEKVRMESGTSFGAAIFTGIAALIVERYGKMDRRGLTAIIEESAKDLGAPGRDKVYGVGLVQVRKILTKGK